MEDLPRAISIPTSGQCGPWSTRRGLSRFSGEQANEDFTVHSASQSICFQCAYPPVEGHPLRQFSCSLQCSSSWSILRTERLLSDRQARAFDHGAHALLDLHRRLRINLGGTISPFVRGVNTVSEDENISNDTSSTEWQPAFDAHAWEEEAPQCQLNGGSDPVVVTATYVVNYGQCLTKSGGRFGEDSNDLAVSAAARSLLGDVSSGCAFSSGGAKAGRGGWVTLRIRAYNATNARLLGFTIRLSFGQGAEPVGMGDGGRVEASVNEV